jgi:hypothetical protein
MGISKEQLASIITGRAKNLCNPEGDRLVEGYTQGGNRGGYDPDPSSFNDDADRFDRMYLSSYDEPESVIRENYSQSYAASNSRMPEDIKRSMMEHHIDTSKLSNNSVLDTMGIRPTTERKNKPQLRENVQQTTQGGGIDYSIIKAIVNECLNEHFGKQALNESTSLQSIGLSNGTISLVDNKGNVFKAKLEKIGNTNDKK